MKDNKNLNNKKNNRKTESKAAKIFTIVLIVIAALALLLDIYLVLDRYVLDKPEETTAASSTIRSGDYIYKIAEDGSAQLVSYYGSDQTVSLPTELNGHSLTSLGDDCFAYAVSVTKLVIPDSVKTIGAYAFSQCEEMKEIIIPKSVTSIGKGAFYSCSSLEKVRFTGTKEEWQALNIPTEDNEALTSVVYFYNYIPE